MGRMYDTTRLDQLGRKMARLREEEAEIQPQLAAEIFAAAEAGLPQVEIVRRSGYTRDAVRKICLRKRQMAAAGDRT